MTVSASALIRITPAGHVYPVDGAGADSAWPKRLKISFAAEDGFPRLLLDLATTHLDADLPPELDFLRKFTKKYLTLLCHSPESEHPAGLLAALPAEEELTAFLMAVPPMPGAEYLSRDVLAAWWQMLDAYVQAELAAQGESVARWIPRRCPQWRTVGRVTFHLAENKRDQSRPFAFMATYTDRVAEQAQPVQLPLARALQEYASAKNRPALLRLLQPITAAAETCPWVGGMVEDGTIYQPRAWSPRQAYCFLQDIPDLENAGVIVRVPDWWKAGAGQTQRPVVRVKIAAENEKKHLSADSLLNFEMETVLDGQTLTQKELAEILAAGENLVRLRGQWVEVDREKLQAALDHWKVAAQHVGEGGLSFYEAMRMLSGLPPGGGWDELEEEAEIRRWSEVVPVGKLAEVLASMRDPDGGGMKLAVEKLGLNATLRPYQETGVRWLRQMAMLGLGACLADDMGLGKTIQVIALLLCFRQEKPRRGEPALLVAPASLLGNWESEIRRFAPQLKTHILHPSGAGTAEPKAAALAETDLIMTTYGMAQRLAWLGEKHWRAVILDEAQAIKNAATKQTKAVKTLRAASRVALTGTPIENRLSDLWSLFDFLNPGLLGSGKAFSQFVKSLAPDAGKKKNANTAEKLPPDYAPLRKLTQPYILRRMKTDKRIISDLPDKTEVTAWCGLAKPQAVLYAQSVKQLQRELEESEEGIQRRGLILAYLMRFKQICNHPSQWTGDGDFAPARSGKFARLAEICEEIASRQEKALIFTQFREMTQPLERFLREIFGRAGIILDGSTAVKRRQEMVTAFQSEAGPPFFVLSLKAGGTGLNLTAASHVIHFDRWWNPAVESQATDRAFRIGQQKNVLVHKFVCRGTIEERIDAMIESKKALAQNVIGAGGTEPMITEMTDEQLLELVALDIHRAEGG